MAETEPLGAEPAAPGEVRIRRALLSVSDKRGLVEFARGLVELGVEIVSTGGTARELEEQGIDTRPVEDYTGFPEILDGRVKTLNPRIYAGVLAVRSNEEHIETLQRARGRAHRPGLREPLSVRARVGAARGGGRRGDREHRHRRADADPGRGEEPCVRGRGRGAGELRRGAGRAAGVGLAAVASDAPEPRHGGVRIHRALRRSDLALVRGARGGLPGPVHALVREGARSVVRREPAPASGVLRGGRRTHAPDVDGVEAARQGAVVQQPARPRLRPAADRGLRAPGRGDHQAQQPVRRGRSAPALGDAFDKALATDPQSAFGGVFCFNRPVDRALAEKLSEMFVEAVFAPGYEEDALELLQQKPNVRLLENQERRTTPIVGARHQARARRHPRCRIATRGSSSATRCRWPRSASRPRRSGESCCSACACASTCARTRS